ncbi:MAG TPA: NAD(P)H-binding protein [Streptosporangiaceae bacterium]|nr:NAD(P)H-binding protein [Streptosporangiaceae bacterium]
MKIAVIGGSGHLGHAVALEALSRGHQVTAIARDVSRIKDLPGAAVVSADVFDHGAIARAVAGHDAVVAAAKGAAGQPAAAPLVAHALLDVLPKAGVRRLLFLGGGGSLEAAPGQRFVDLPQFPPEHKSEALGQAEALGLLRGSGDALDWSYLSPPPVHLVDSEKTGAYRVQAGNTPITDTGGDSRISVADYAAAAVDDLERGTFVGQRFTAAY